jgi:cytochrome c oxidase assembly protein subunit 15
MKTEAFLRLRRALTATLALSVLVVFAGATVRATGSGMGCPDWPLCFGCLVPPVSVTQLPSGFAQKYAVDGHPAEFDAVKTWIEYGNRLLGALCGLSLVLTAVLTVFVARRRPSLAVLVFLSLVVLGFVAWLGARVVGTFLAPYAVTLHLLSSYSLLALLLAQREIVGRVLDGPRPPPARPIIIGLAALGLAFFVQWTLGIRVRDELESWIWDRDLDDSFISILGGAYDLHRATATVVALTAGVLAWLGWRNRTRDHRLAALTLTIAVFVALQAAVGLVLWLGGLPAWAKPFHLLFATGAWSVWVAALYRSLLTKRSPRV